MRTIQFQGPPVVQKIIRREDFEKVGVNDQGDVEFYGRDLVNKGIRSVSDAAAEYLVSADRFAFVDDEPAEVAPGDEASSSDPVPFFDQDTSETDTGETPDPDELEEDEDLDGA